MKIEQVDVRESNWGLTLDWVIQQDSLRQGYLGWDLNDEKEPVVPGLNARERALQVERITKAKGLSVSEPGLCSREKTVARAHEGEEVVRGVMNTWSFRCPSDTQEEVSNRQCFSNFNKHVIPARILLKMEWWHSRTRVEPKCL